MIFSTMQINTTTRYHSTPITMANNHTNERTNCWWGFGATGSFYSLLVRMQIDTAILEDSLASLTNLNIISPYNPAYICTKTCMQMITDVVFIIPKKLEATKISFKRWWINYSMPIKWNTIVVTNKIN